MAIAGGGAALAGAGAELSLKRRWYTPCMANLEQLDWIDAFVVAGYGVRIGVRVSDPALIPQLAERLPPGTRIGRPGPVDRMLSVILGGPGARRGERRFHMLYADHSQIVRAREFMPVLDSFDAHLRMALAQFSKRRLFIHGGAVAWKGRAILFPGKSLAGKTHLVAEMIKAGADYLSDEYAIIGEDGMVQPFAKPLSLRDTPTAKQRETAPEALGARTAKRPVPAGLIVMTQYREGARWLPKPLSPAAGALQLMENAVGARMDPARTLDVLGAFAGQVPAIRSDRGDAKAIVPKLLDLIG